MNKIALFPGTFDPPTLGHMEIILQASALFDRVYIAVAPDSTKSSHLFSFNDRMMLLRTMTSELSNVSVIELSGLTVDCAAENKAQYIVRGLRNDSDFNYEFSMAATNRLMSGVETVVFFSSPQCAHISSTLVREIATHGHTVEEFLPKSIASTVFEMLYRT